MSDSVHAAHWISQLVGTHWDIHLFPCDGPGDIHPDFCDITLHDMGLWRPKGLQSSVRVAGLWPLPKGAFKITRFKKWLGLGQPDRAKRLAQVIKHLKPDIIHSLEMQHASYLTMQARNLSRARFPTWIYSSWGSDLYYFGQFPEHVSKIKAIMDVCDYHVSDCQRDIVLVREYGYHGETGEIFPGHGGYPVAEIQKLASSLLPSQRRLIMVKGRENWSGRALDALEAIHRCSDMLAGYEICIYCVSEGVLGVAKHVQRMTGLNIRVLDGQHPHNEILTLMGQARIALALSVTDGTPNSMLEAMMLGAFPVQSDTGAIGEWIEDGKNGLIVPCGDTRAAENALRRALQDDSLVNQAAIINFQISNDRLDKSKVRPRVLAMYDRILMRHREERRTM
jgi:glycosyltransferase involved in cell wall biosynthesis